MLCSAYEGDILLKEKKIEGNAIGQFHWTFSSPEINYLLKEGAQSHWTGPVLPQRNASLKMAQWKSRQ